MKKMLRRLLAAMLWNRLRTLAVLLGLLAVVTSADDPAWQEAKPQLAGAVVRDTSAWPPPNWDTTLPPGVQLLNAHGYRIVPDPKLTPGANEPTHDATWIATKGNVKAYRDVPNAEKEAVYTAYKITQANRESANQWAGGPGFEVDHLESIEIGGANLQPNLWPEPYFDAWNARDKDRLEDFLGRMVKARTITVGDAQQAVVLYHWPWSYIHYFGGAPTDAQPKSKTHQQAAASMRQ